MSAGAKRKGKWKKYILWQHITHLQTILPLIFFCWLVECLCINTVYCCSSVRTCSVYRSTQQRSTDSWSDPLFVQHSFHFFSACLIPFVHSFFSVSPLNLSLKTGAYPSMYWAEGKETSWPWIVCHRSKMIIYWQFYSAQCGPLEELTISKDAPSRCWLMCLF